MESLRRATVEDIFKILRVERACFSKPWTEQMFLGEFKNPLAHYFVIEVDGELIGFLGIWCILDEGHITNIAIHPNFQKKGYGTKLLEWAIGEVEKEGVKNLTLEVRVSNKKAIELYEKFGFKTSGIRKAYYEDNKEDALIMWRSS